MQESTGKVNPSRSMEENKQIMKHEDVRGCREESLCTV